MQRSLTYWVPSFKHTKFQRKKTWIRQGTFFLFIYYEDLFASDTDAVLVVVLLTCVLVFYSFRLSKRPPDSGHQYCWVKGRSPTWQSRPYVAEPASLPAYIKLCSNSAQTDRLFYEAPRLIGQTHPTSTLPPHLRRAVDWKYVGQSSLPLFALILFSFRPAAVLF